MEVKYITTEKKKETEEKLEKRESGENGGMLFCHFIQNNKKKKQRGKKERVNIPKMPLDKNQPKNVQQRKIEQIQGIPDFFSIMGLIFFCFVNVNSQCHKQWK